MRIEPLGDSAFVITLDDASRAAAVAEAICARRLPDVTDVVPAFETVGVFFDADAADAPGRDGSDGREARLRRLLDEPATQQSGAAADGRLIELATIYDGPDLGTLAATLKLRPDELIARHSGGTYTALAVGFTPGFAYLGGLPPELHAPRRGTPRPRVEPGSVAIGGPYTGVYPSPTPGGWHVIGRTTEPMFDLSRDPPSRLRVGDRVRFLPCARVPAGEGVATRSTPTIARPRGSGGIAFLTSGTHTTVQDLGRAGYRAAGVPRGGAIDPLACAIANRLVGNDDSCAAIECALVGPRLRFGRDAIVALCGATVDGLPNGRPFRVRRGDALSLERLTRGAYAYLAIAGGIDVPPVLGSRSTDARLGIGHVLRTGDTLAIGKPRRRVVLRDGWRVAIEAWDDRASPIRYLPGDVPLPGEAFTISSRSDRMGVRLAATAPTRAVADGSGQSRLVAPGTIQLPPDGEPIVLLADAQTIGGYAIAGHVIRVDQRRLAQRRPGEAVRFVAVTIDDAIAAANRAAREAALRRVAIHQFATRP